MKVCITTNNVMFIIWGVCQRNLAIGSSASAISFLGTVQLLFSFKSSKFVKGFPKYLIFFLFFFCRACLATVGFSYKVHGSLYANYDLLSKTQHDLLQTWEYFINTIHSNGILNPTFSSGSAPREGQRA